MRKQQLFLTPFLFFALFLLPKNHANAQFYSIKTNLLGWATTNMNVEAGMTLNRKLSLHLPITYNPFVFKNNKRMQNLTVQPGVRYWFLESYVHGFIGVNGIASTYHLSDKKYRYEGDAYGLGLSYGYAKLLSPRWNMELETGWGLVWADYTKYACKECGKKLGQETRWYLIPTKASLSIVYLF